MASEGFSYPIGGQGRGGAPKRGGGFSRGGKGGGRPGGGFKRGGKGGGRSGHFGGRKGKGPRHPAFAEREETRIPEMPSTPPPAAYEASVFGKLDIRLQHAIADAQYAVPTPIQEKSIPDLLAGRDIIGCAQTGTGKTAAFMLPILNALLGPSEPQTAECGHPLALVLSPTRELAAQIAECAGSYAKYTPLKYAVIFGGVSQVPQEKALKRGCEIVIATPGRLIDLMTQGLVYLDKVKYFVLDEADRMLDMGFLPDIQRIISKLPPAEMSADGTATRQTMFFSATLGAPIMKLAGELVVNPVSVSVSPDTPTVDKINQRVMFVEKSSKDALLVHLLKTHPEWVKTIVFARTRHGADRIERKLLQADIEASAIHSDKTQNQRMRALKGFKEGRVKVLVATDIASRGIDVPSVSLVVNMELPMETESYIHRIGRTARAGESGCAVSFVSCEESGLLRAVERLIKKSIDTDRDQPFHSEAAEAKCGRNRDGLPTAPWIGRASRPPKGKGGQGDRQGQGGRPGPGGHPKPGGGVWMKKEKKFTHPANKKGKGGGRVNFKGRRQPDFGRG